MDLQVQGSKPKTAVNTQECNTWHAMLVEPHMMLMVKDGDPVVQGVHFVLTYETIRRTHDSYSGKYLVAVGERLKDESCTFVKT